MHPRGAYRDTQQGTADDWNTVSSELKTFAAALPDRVLAHLRLLEGDCGTLPVDRLTHSLQAATRAYCDGRDEEYVVCALLHDIGDTLGSFNHPDIAAAILKPFVSPENFLMVEMHGIFQGYYPFQHPGMERNLRDQFVEQALYDRTLEFCEKYDAPAFDPEYDTLPIDFFEPMLRCVMKPPKNTLYKTIADRKAS
jgi:predicted HD phosphohydrolase